MNIHFLDLEQPTTCPKCGARTQFEDLYHQLIPSQKHYCLNKFCKYEFIGEFDTELPMTSSDLEESNGNQ